jgi:hypothetical protein
VYTIAQMVVGMPGENDQTVAETIEFSKYATERMPEPPTRRLSINYFQALPGTPGYEFMRSKGLIGKSLEDEEDYLFMISDIDASSFDHYQNVSESSKERARTWVSKIVRETSVHYYKKRNWNPVETTARMKVLPDYERGSYFRTFKTKYRFHPKFLRVFSPFRFAFDYLNIFRHRVHLYGWTKATLLSLGLLPEEDRSEYLLDGRQSLRKVVKFPESSLISLSEKNMIPLRMGR